MKFPILLSCSILAVVAAGFGKTTRYWDCCKPSCGWYGKANLKESPVQACDASNHPIDDNGETMSGCNGGGSYMCASQHPWAVNDNLAYGFAGVRIQGQTEANWCCACYELTFTNGPVQGKRMIVQATNTGGDYGDNQFNLQIPGGGVGSFNGCKSQWSVPLNVWGQQYGGIESQSQCSDLPSALRDGCNWRFNWFKNADNPSVDFRKVSCPSAITDKTKCFRNE